MVNASSEPYSESCWNVKELWTCPGCYTDFPKATKSGIHTCANCRRLVSCKARVVQEYVSTLVSKSEAGEDE
jgi:protein-arginine kinase activator protein McsA